ncbi:hypothetical protein SKUN_001307 [Spiroplasma kunkelii CR2-3x]|uniref:Uncharacterized protein n=2 Tax=Spiroplasma kunkelii TaxID=47834 RepID=A0A0K2JHV5_SPIKU|nr:hypothetical protein SKUN_001307 [Spiroplasma kunkelii CR2-3x]
MIIDLKNTFNNQTNKQNRKIVEQYNLISKEDKQKRLDAINELYQSLPDDEKKFKEKIKKVGTTAYAAGINIEHNDKYSGVIASTLIS